MQDGVSARQRRGPPPVDDGERSPHGLRLPCGQVVPAPNSFGASANDLRSDCPPRFRRANFGTTGVRTRPAPEGALGREDGSDACPSTDDEAGMGAPESPDARSKMRGREEQDEEEDDSEDGTRTGDGRSGSRTPSRSDDMDSGRTTDEEDRFDYDDDDEGDGGGRNGCRSRGSDTDSEADLMAELDALSPGVARDRRRGAEPTTAPRGGTVRPDAEAPSAIESAAVLARPVPTPGTSDSERRALPSASRWSFRPSSPPLRSDYVEAVAVRKPASRSGGVRGACRSVEESIDGTLKELADMEKEIGRIMDETAAAQPQQEEKKQQQQGGEAAEGEGGGERPARKDERTRRDGDASASRSPSASGSSREGTSPRTRRKRSGSPQKRKRSPRRRAGEQRSRSAPPSTAASPAESPSSPPPRSASDSEGSSSPARRRPDRRALGRASSPSSDDSAVRASGSPNGDGDASRSPGTDRRRDRGERGDRSPPDREGRGRRGRRRSDRGKDRHAGAERIRLSTRDRELLQRIATADNVRRRMLRHQLSAEARRLLDQM